MSELKNKFHTELAIGILLQDEDTLEEKLNLLTELSLSTTKRETFEICEGFRERLCNEQEAKSRNYSLPAIHKVERSGSNGNEVSDAINGDE